MFIVFGLRLSLSLALSHSSFLSWYAWLTLARLFINIVVVRTPSRSRDSSPDPPIKPQRGRPPNGTKPWYLNRFKGVRKRRNVRGFLVEIRPPRWKKTIWLGTYNTDEEAAGAFDAGLFYTKKKIRYNFPMLAKSFPPLPEDLALDREEDAEKIKEFVKAQAAQAAAKIKSMNIVSETTDNSRSPINICNEAENNYNDRVVENTSHIPSCQESAQPADLTSHDFCVDQYAHNLLCDQPDFDQYALQDMIHDYLNYHQFTPLVPYAPMPSFGDAVTDLNVGDMADHGVSRMLPSNLDLDSEDY